MSSAVNANRQVVIEMPPIQPTRNQEQAVDSATTEALARQRVDRQAMADATIETRHISMAVAALQLATSSVLIVNGGLNNIIPGAFGLATTMVGLGCRAFTLLKPTAYVDGSAAQALNLSRGQLVNWLYHMGLAGYAIYRFKEDGPGALQALAAVDLVATLLADMHTFRVYESKLYATDPTFRAASDALEAGRAAYVHYGVN